MSEPPKPPKPPAPPEPPLAKWRYEKSMTLLEGRRLAIDGFMWQAPALTLVAQAFLLRVLTDGTVSCWTAGVVALAGSLATGAAILALWILRNREAYYSGRVTYYAAKLGIEDPRGIDGLRARAGRPRVLRLNGYKVWTVALGSFVVADFVAFGQTHELRWPTVVAAVVAVAVVALVTFARTPGKGSQHTA